ncbi:MAG: single-stranded-DNA-specific exonuclease RecJ, partial [Bacteroidota bacterium]
MEKLWKIKARGNESDIRKLSADLGITPSLANLLVQRDVHSFDEAKAFFRPTLDQLHDPFLMKDMEKAVTRIEKAMRNKEKIMIYGDYDVDGTTSVALMYSYLHARYENLDYYIPDRYSEGYGISYKSIDYANKNDVSLIIALDCGIKAIEKVKYANQRNIDFIICDHHTPGEFIPDALAVLDPKQSDCPYPFKELSGCGVGFKLIQAMAQKNTDSFEHLLPLLDLVVVSIASDIVPIIGENRVMAYYGLKVLNHSPRLGLKTIIEIAGIHKDIKIDDIVFKIGPRINAAGRMESGRKAVELLITDDYSLAHERGEKINAFNKQRRNIDHTITEQALESIASDPVMRNRRSTVLFNPSWHKGVVGIVASRII